MPEFRLLVNLLSVSVAPCRGGLCRSPAISHNQHHTASPRHSHNQYTAPIEDGPLVPMSDSRLAGGAKTSPRCSSIYAASWLGRLIQRSSAVIPISLTVILGLQCTSEIHYRTLTVCVHSPSVVLLRPWHVHAKKPNMFRTSSYMQGCAEQQRRTRCCTCLLTAGGCFTHEVPVLQRGTSLTGSGAVDCAISRSFYGHLIYSITSIQNPITASLAQSLFQS